MPVEYTAALDASGVTNQSLVVFAGCLSPGRDWLKFTKAWAAVLRRYGIPYFHAAEFFGKRPYKIFAGWTENQRADLISELIPIFQNRIVFPFGGVLSKDDYEAAVAETGKKHPLGAEGLCLMECLKQLTCRFRDSSLPPDEMINMVLDWEDKRNLRRKWQHVMVRDWNPTMERIGFPARIGPPSFKSKVDFEPLQAADLLAHQAFQHQVHPTLVSTRTDHIVNCLLVGKKHGVVRLTSDRVVHVLREAGLPA